MSSSSHFNEGEIVNHITRYVLQAEHACNAFTAKANKFEKVLEILHRIQVHRDRQELNNEDTRPLDSILSEAAARLNEALEHENNPSVEHGILSYDFDDWAQEIQSSVRIQDDLMLSVDSSLLDITNETKDSSVKPHTGTRSGKRDRFDGPTSRTATTLLEVLKSNGRYNAEEIQLRNEKDDRFFCLTTTAWSIAVIGMLVTIGFLSNDFWKAQRNLAIEIERTDIGPLRLPAVTVCGNERFVGSFRKFPTKKYPGLPLFGVTRVRRNERATGESEDLIVRENGTLKIKNGLGFEDVVVGNGITQEKNEGFDAEREMRSLNQQLEDYEQTSDSIEPATYGFYYCVRVGKTHKEILQPFETQNGLGPVDPAIQIRFFRLRLFDVCRSDRARRNRRLAEMLTSELLIHAKGLESHGILNFSGHDSSVLRPSLYDLGDKHWSDFYCNVYFFSGFFYPTVRNVDISYSYNPSSPSRWMRTGTGPYYTAFKWPKGNDVVTGPDVQAMLNDSYSRSGLQFFVEDAETASDTGFVEEKSAATVMDQERMILTFERVLTGNEVQFRTKEAYSINDPIGSRIAEVYDVLLDFSTFATERIKASPTMSWPEFLTDVFEFIGLFTGICIFTLIVAPAHSLV